MKLDARVRSRQSRGFDILPAVPPAARSAVLLDGAALARKIRERAARSAAQISASGRAPFLRVLLVGENPASQSYVASKAKAAEEAGIRAETRRLPADLSPDALLAEVARANADPAVDGLLVQLPLPKGHDTARVLDAVDPLKDVDGFHPENVGLLHQGRPRFVPCTPAGIVELLEAYEIPTRGRRAVVLGRSDIVGKPMAALLTARDATVTVCHSKTPDLPSVCREADMLVAAIGRPGFVTREFVKRGSRRHRRGDQPHHDRGRPGKSPPLARAASGPRGAAVARSSATSTSTTSRPSPAGSLRCPGASVP